MSINSVTDSQEFLFISLQCGKDLYFRVHALGANGPSGWSDVATMMVVWGKGLRANKKGRAHHRTMVRLL